MRQIFTDRKHTNALLEIASKRGAVDHIAAFDYYVKKGCLCGYGRM